MPYPTANLGFTGHIYKADVDTGDSFPRKVLLELQGLECAGGRLPAWLDTQFETGCGRCLCFSVIW